ncbi:c-type cytochrome [Thiobacillus sp.]
MMFRFNSGCVDPLQRKADFLRLLASIISIAFANVLANHAHADPLAGAALAQKGGAGIPACMACHGSSGEGQAASGFPRLAGLHQAYLVKQLREFAGGQRKNPQMEPIASALDARQISDVSDYYASLPGWKPKENTVVSVSQDALGFKLATSGNWNKGMPACFACHGDGGAGIPPHFPALAGQPSAYIRAQLKAWQSATRANDPQGLMMSIAVKMTDAEIDAVSLYLENPSIDGKGK